MGQGWVEQNLGVLITILVQMFLVVIWAMHQKGRLDSALERIESCEKVARNHSESIDTKLETMDARLRRMGSQLDRLLGASGRRIDDHLEEGV
jgi:hypothetical protein